LSPKHSLSYDYIEYYLSLECRIYVHNGNKIPSDKKRILRRRCLGMKDFVTDLDLLTDCRLLCSRIYATLYRLPEVWPQQHSILKNSKRLPFWHFVCKIVEVTATNVALPLWLVRPADYACWSLRRFDHFNSDSEWIPDEWISCVSESCALNWNREYNV
jgi:hypothetical protein